MSIKTIFIIILSVMTTIILMNNNDEVPVWLFGQTHISKLAIFAVMFGMGFIIGILVSRPRRKKIKINEPEGVQKPNLSSEDQEYIS